MTIERELWQTAWADGEFPSLPCPTCDARLNFDESSFRCESSKHNVELVDIAGIDEALARFSGMFVCGHAKCGEIVMVAGDCSYEYGYGPNGETVTEQTLHPRSMHPGPPVISISAEVTDEIQSALTSSYPLLWSDYDACASKLRVVLERILSNEGFPAAGVDGKLVPLHQRILAWQEHTGATSIAKSLMAIKWLGNVGAHESDLSLNDVLNAYEILERLLQQLFPPDTTHLDALTDRINEMKGRST